MSDILRINVNPIFPKVFEKKTQSFHFFWWWVDWNMKNTKLALGAIVFLILVLGALFIFFTFEDVLEESAYELINKNLWLGLPLVIIGYVLFETIQGRFGKQLLDSDYL